MFRKVLIFCVALPCLGAEVSYDRDIRPILSANCFACHGPDEHSRKAKLRLDRFEDATRKKEDVQPIAPGKPDQSELIRRVTTSDVDDIMPPPKSGNKLTVKQIDLLKRWIQEGAVYAKHWSFAELKRPEPPRVANRSWPRNDIDRFILDRLQKEGLKPEREADRRTLLRRVTLDLIGLPPTRAEVEDFLADKSSDAYERAVDRLLASKSYGEHWARMWLDLARYADTKGYEKDQARSIWRYRDWVIDAFNADLPYDQFTREQLAGDLLPNPTPDQILATAFHRNTMTNDEGGTDDEEYRVLAVKDRVDTTAQVWMGLTMGCAKCHSHKYDPITHNEYYNFYALFNQTEDADRGDEMPTAPMPTAEQREARAGAERKLQALEKDFWREIPGLAEKQRVWEHEIVAANPWTALQFVSGAGVGGSELKAGERNVIHVSGAFPETETNIVKFVSPSGRVTGLRLEALEPQGRKGPGRNKGDRNIVISEFEASAGGKPIRLTNARADFSQSGWEAPFAIDGDAEKGWAFSPQVDRPHVILFDLSEPTELTGEITVTLSQRYAKLQLEYFRISFTTNETSSLKPDVAAGADLAALPPEKRTDAERKSLEEAYRKAHEPTANVYQEITKARDDLKQIDEAIAKTPIMRELALDHRRKTRVHRRGNFLDPGDDAIPGLPAAFGSFPAGAPTNRLGVAEWLMSLDNPLTARVAANRAWARLFGTGPVETEEDFGAQGAAPSHPELLDWLAVEFRDADQWHWKKLLKTIVMSATYRQSSHQDASKLEKDPRNRWLSRAPRIRLPAETVRDQALGVSGLLSPKTHGPSVMPPQPDGIWRAVYSGLKWQTSPGEDRYRRSLYTFLRRTSPYPSLTTFDSGSGEVCLVRRIRTNTPLQALVTLNDPAFFEAAGALGRKLDEAGGERAIDFGFESVLGRPARKEERARIQKLFADAQSEFAGNAQAASDLLKDANVKAEGADRAALAAWISVANVLLNLDETLTRP